MSARSLLKLMCTAALAFVCAAQSAHTAAKPQQRASKPATEADEARAAQRQRRLAINAVKTWGVQLRYLDRAAIAAAPLDLVVMDYAPHPKKDVEIPYTADEIAGLKTKPDGGRRLVISYLSIGEAERYRSYWKREWDAPETRPQWLGAENPLWPGNYLVTFTDPDWQTIIFGTPESYLDRIIAAGFDGVYLDRSDAFQDPGQIEDEAADAMVRYLSRLSDHARRLNPHFIIIMQNAEELIRFSALRQRLDGISKEDLSFGNDNSSFANTPQMVRESLVHLRRAKKAGLAVFTLEYVSDAEKTAHVRSIAAREGFGLYVTERLLDKIKLDGVAPSAAAPAARREPVDAPSVAQ